MFDRINLVPQAPVSDTIKKITPVMLLGIACFFTAVFYFQKNRLEADLLRVESDLDSIQSRIGLNEQLLVLSRQLNADIASFQKHEADLRSRIDLISVQGGNKKIFSEVLRGITESLPPSVKCNRISLSKNGGTVSGVALDYDHLPGMINELAGNALFKNPVLRSVSRIGKDETVRYSFFISFDLS